MASACWGAGEMTWVTARRMVPTECGTAVQMGRVILQLSIGGACDHKAMREAVVVCTASGTGLKVV